jgi:hypothetical protein
LRKIDQSHFIVAAAFERDGLRAIAIAEMIETFWPP